MQTKTSLLKVFWREEHGQDLVEYSLLLAFVCLASAAMFIAAGKTITGIWTYTNTTMTQAYCAASSS